MTGGFLQVVPPEDVQRNGGAGESSVDETAQLEPQLSDIAHHVRKRWDTFRRHRTEALSALHMGTPGSTSSLNDRLLAALRSYQGQYSAQKIAEIQKFGGSQVFSKLTAVKCRGATAMLRDIFLNGKRTWELEPTPDPEVPDDVKGAIDELLMTEQLTIQRAGQPLDTEAVDARRDELLKAAELAAVKQATEAAARATNKLDDYLVEGGFYQALLEFLTDLPIFYLACIKGPTVQMVDELSWEDGQPVIERVPKMFWYRVSPFDLYWTPGAATIEEAEIIEKVRFTRADLNQLIGVPGFDEDAIKAVLAKYKDGYMEYPDDFESQRADLESREDMHSNRSELIEGLEYHGAVQGQVLLDAGIPEDEIPDPVLDYMVTVWQVAEYTLKVQINPNPKQRHPYYTSCFEKVPGSIPGNGVTDIIDDIQAVANATLRSLVNNLAISSGPQVAVTESRLSPTTDPDSLYPWKRWRFEDDPLAPANTAPPISFFQPASNAQELLSVFEKMTTIADETSAIPRYITGNRTGGGAASTASGLSMLMNNASKVLQNIAAQIDTDIFKAVLQDLYTYVMLTDDSGLLRGDEQIQVRGVTIAMQKEQDRMRKLEFLNITGNPVDAQIMGVDGRAAILRDLAEELGMPGEKIIPTEDELKAKQEAQSQQALVAAAAQAQGSRPPNPGADARPAQELDNSFRTNT